MKQHEEKSADDKELHKQLDREILLLLRAMSPDKRRESVAYIMDTYGDKKTDRCASLLCVEHRVLRRRATKANIPHKYRTAANHAL